MPVSERSGAHMRLGIPLFLATAAHGVAPAPACHRGASLIRDAAAIPRKAVIATAVGLAVGRVTRLADPFQPRRLLVVGGGLTSAAILRRLGYVTVHTSTIGRHLGRLQRLWTTSGTRAGSRIDASASETPAERRTAASLWAIASRLGGRGRLRGSPPAPTKPSDPPAAAAPHSARRKRTPLGFRRLGRAAVAGLTAACSSGGLAFGVRRGYRASLAIPRMYWARPGRLRPV